MQIHHAPQTAGKMAGAAAAFLASLDAGQAAIATVPFSPHDLGDTRREWTYLPVEERPGLPLSALSDPQRKLGHELIVAATSMPGYAKVVSIMAMEHVRRATMRLANPAVAHIFDPERYYFRVFGDPVGRDPWGWQLAGHHVSLNFTVAGELVSGTPCMLGSVPASYGTLNPLADDEEAGFKFLHALTPAQREMAVIWHRPPPDFATRLAPRIGPEERPDHVFAPEPGYRIDDAEREVLSYIRGGPKGISGSALHKGQVDYLMVLIAGFAGRLPEDVGAAALRRAKAAADPSLTFAWAGGINPGEQHYFRVQAPGLLIEHDNTQGGGKHIHSVWRDPDNDWGDDILARHYRTADHQPTSNAHGD